MNDEGWAFKIIELAEELIDQLEVFELPNSTITISAMRITLYGVNILSGLPNSHSVIIEQ